MSLSADICAIHGFERARIVEGKLVAVIPLLFGWRLTVGQDFLVYDDGW